MLSVLNNPFRILGLLIGASAQQFNKHRTRIPNYLSAGNEIPAEFTDFCFEALGQLNRTTESVSDAASKLNLDSDKMSFALFWFYKGNPITDEPAFDAIKEADFDQVVNIWSKLTSNGEVTQRNASAYCNLGTLYLSGIFDRTNSNVAIWEQGISLKLKFLESDFIEDFKVLATDEKTYKTTKKELQLLFLNQVQSEVEKSGTISSNNFLDILTKQEFSAKEDFLKGYVQKPIEQIEKKVEEAKSKRKANKANAFKTGEELYEETSENLEQLKSILGTSNLKFSSISDKVSEEILQCGIDYFSYYQDSSLDPSGDSMNLFRKAKTLAIGNIAKQRCKENTENLQEWIDNKPEREKQSRILVDFENLKNLIDDFEERSETVSNARQLLVSARPFLNNVKSVLGNTDEIYLGLSSRIASDAQGMCISEINLLQERLERSIDGSTLNAAIVLLKERVAEAWEVTVTIESMDLLEEFRKPFVQNKISLLNLKNQLSGIKTESESINSSGTQKQAPVEKAKPVGGNKKSADQGVAVNTNGTRDSRPSQAEGSNSRGGSAKRPSHSGGGPSSRIGTSKQTDSGGSLSNSGSAKRPSQKSSGNSNDFGARKQTQARENKSNSGSAKRPSQLSARNSGKADTFWKTQSGRTERNPGKNNGGGNNSGKCYIATMAYGSYDHPQVMVLRQFRDDILKKTIFGRWFIKIYYYYSPKLVEKLQNKNRTNRIIRSILNHFIKLIKLKY